MSKRLTEQQGTINDDGRPLPSHLDGHKGFHAHATARHSGLQPHGGPHSHAGNVMTESKHTPEPWEMVLTQSKKPDEEGDYAIVAYVAGEKRIIGECYRTVGREPISPANFNPAYIHAPADANARLIAAAPVMLDALRNDACACKGANTTGCYLHGTGSLRTDIDATGTKRARHLATARAIINRIESGNA